MEQIKFTSLSSSKVVECNIKNLRNLVFEVTDSCNLRCKYCGYAEFHQGYDPRKNSSLSFDKAKVLIDYLANIWRGNKYENISQLLTVSFYGGEPLMNIKFIKQTIDYFDSLNDIGRRIRYNMTTNATLLDHHMDYIVENDIQLLISLDGDEDGHSYRVDTLGKNSFGKVIKNLKLLKQKYPEYFETQVNFNAVLHDRNEVETIFNFIYNEFGKSPKISALNNNGIKNEKREEFRRTYKDVIQSFQRAPNCKDMIESAFLSVPQVNALSKYIYNRSGNVYDGYYSLKVNKSLFRSMQTGTCTPFMLKMFVTVNGKILQCEKIQHSFALGQLYDDRVELDYDKIVQFHNRHLKKIEGQCSVCSNGTRCALCMYQIDDMDSDIKTIHCPYFTTSPQSDEEQRNMDFLRENPKLYGRIMREIPIK